MHQQPIAGIRANSTLADVQLYSSSPGYETISASVESRDAALLGFAKECAKAGTRCSFRLNTTDTGDDIVDRIYGMMKVRVLLTRKYQPLMFFNRP